MVADTDVLLDALRGGGAFALVTTLMRTGRLATTAVTVFEMWRGASTDVEREEVRRLLRGIRVYAFNDVAARRAAQVEQELRNAPIGERDTFIAGVCLAIGRPLLTRNVRHFRRVAGLEAVQAR